MGRGIVTHRYLHLPVQNGAPKVQLSVQAGNHTRLFEMELATGEPDFWAFVDLGEFVGEHAEGSLLSLSQHLEAVPRSGYSRYTSYKGLGGRY